MANMMDGYYQDAEGIYHKQFGDTAHDAHGRFASGKGGGGKGGAAPAAGGGGALPAGTHKMADGKIHMNPAPGQTVLGASNLNSLKGHVKEGDSVSASTRKSGSINGTVSHVADGKLHLTNGSHIGPEHSVVALHVTPKGGTNSAEGEAHAGNASGLKAAGSVAPVSGPSRAQVHSLGRVSGTNAKVGEMSGGKADVHVAGVKIGHISEHNGMSGKSYTAHHDHAGFMNPTKGSPSVDSAKRALVATHNKWTSSGPANVAQGS